MSKTNTLSPYDNEQSEKISLKDKLFGIISVADSRTKKIAITLILSFTLMIVFVIIMFSLLITKQFQNAFSREAAQLTNMINSQMCLNIENYMNQIESNADMIFTNATSDYDPVSKSYSTYEKIMISEDISSNLKMLSHFENYTDFFIMYSNGELAGTVSDNTKKLLGSEIYDEFAQRIGAGYKVWCAGINKDYSHIYYARKVNTNAILIVSLYTKEIINSLDSSLNINNMNVYLTTSDNAILYSTNGSQPGSLLDNYIRRRLKSDGGTTLDKSYLVSSDDTANGYHVITVIPAEDIMKAVSDTKLYVSITSIVFAILSIIFTIILANKIVKDVNIAMGRLDKKSQTDLLTGIYNKRSFEEAVTLNLSHKLADSSYALIFMDVDNFKSVNDRCGHDVGDDVLKSFSRTLHSVFRESDLKGRLGGDEFCVLMRIPTKSEELLLDYINNACFRFRESLHEKGESGRQSLPMVTSSMGVAIARPEDSSFDDLYHKADLALYRSKKKGKDTWSIYGVGDDKENEEE